MENLPCVVVKRKGRGLREGNNMIKLENWKEVTKGIYRYVISANVAYEIHIMTWNHKTKIESANSVLYIVGDWRTQDGENLFEREKLFSGLLSACIMTAIEDNKENNK